MGSLPWLFRAPVYWSETHFYQTQAMEQTLQQYFEPYGPKAGDPRLIVTAVDIEAGKSQALAAGKRFVHLSIPQHSAQVSQCCLNTLFEGVF